MILKSYSFFDTKTGCFSAPFFMLHEGQAIRAAMEIGGDPSNQIGRYPADYVLYKLGEFDDNTGTLSAYAPANLGVVSSFLVKEPK